MGGLVDTHNLPVRLMNLGSNQFWRYPLKKENVYWKMFDYKFFALRKGFPTHVEQICPKFVYGAY